MSIPTKTDANQWLIDDRPTGLRDWESGFVHRLPAQISSKDRTYTIGASEENWLRLHDTAGQVSRQHATLITDSHGRMAVADLHSKNGIRQDGVRQPIVPLTPGIELGIGGLILIAESPLLDVLRRLLARFIGWFDDRRINLAVRSVRMAVTQRKPLQLCGNDDQTLFSVARLLHSHTLGEARPFAICARRPRNVAAERWANRDGVPRYERGLEALAMAKDGTLCIGPRKPLDFAEVMEAHSTPSARVQVIVCARAPEIDPLIAPVVISPLTERSHEIERIIDEYASDAKGATGSALTVADREWIRSHESTSLAKIEIATLRFVMIRRYGITHAAELLGMSHSSLSEWITRRTLDMPDTELPENDDVS